MDFDLPAELQMLKQPLRLFVDRELIPIEMHSQENNELKPARPAGEKTKDREPWLFDVPRHTYVEVRRSGCGYDTRT